MFFIDRVFGAGLLLLSVVIVVFVVVVCIIVVVVAVTFFDVVPVLLLFFFVVVDPYMFLCLFCFRFFLPHPCCYCSVLSPFFSFLFRVHCAHGDIYIHVIVAYYASFLIIRCIVLMHVCCVCIHRLHSYT